MRRLMTIVLAGSLGFATPVFAQNAASAPTASPVLIGDQGSAPQGANGSGGQDAYAQDQGGGGALTPLLIAGGIGLGTFLAIYLGTQNQGGTRTPASP